MDYKILIADDEPDVVALLKDYFEMNGYRTLTAKNGTEAVCQAQKQPDIILLDINMPDFDGIEVCKRIRNHVNCPILFLTAKVEDRDKISGFAAGGDDYIVKPFSIEELGARVAAHIRRDRRGLLKAKTKFADDFTIDYTAKEVWYKEQPISLAKKEFEILELLSLNPGQVFDKERIYEKLWGYDSMGDASVVAEHIRRLRAKMASSGTKNHIETVWGLGYKWVN